MICLKIRTFVVSATTQFSLCQRLLLLWFAWKFVPLWYQQQLDAMVRENKICCDLLENSYLCGISNNPRGWPEPFISVVICLKIRTFVVSATTYPTWLIYNRQLWFAWKFVPLWYQQQRTPPVRLPEFSCDLLENSYLCGISNNVGLIFYLFLLVVICLKIRTFVVSATTICKIDVHAIGCDLLENSYLCGISNNQLTFYRWVHSVVICLKIRTFVVSATTIIHDTYRYIRLWFAWKFVPLWYQQQQEPKSLVVSMVVICLKIRTFVVSATTYTCS